MKNSVKAYRAKNKITQVQLAGRVGVSRQTIHAIEKNKKHPSVLLALKVASVLNVPIERLFQLEASDLTDKPK